MSFEQELERVSNIIKDNYSTHRLDHRFTPWGISYYWQDAQFQTAERATTLIPELLKLASSNNIRVRSAVCPVPQRQGDALHYEAICLSNQQAIATTILHLTKDQDLHHIVSDERLLGEAATNYVQIAQDQEKPLDFFTFLLHYSCRDDHASLDTSGFHGIYIPLAERLLHRFGAQDQNKIFSINATSIGQAKQLHEIATTHTDTIEDSLISLHDQLHQEYGSNGELDPKKLVPIKSTALPGLKRVRVQAGSCRIDWQKFADNQHRQISIGKALNLRSIYLNSIKDMLYQKWEPEFARDPIDVLQQLEAQATQADQDCVQVYHGVLDVFRDAYKIMQSPNLNHKLRVRTVRRE